MKLRVLLLMFLMLSASGVDADSPQSPAIDLLFDTLPQGRVGVVQISGADITRIRAAFLNHQYVFFPNGENAYQGFISAPIDAKPGWYRLSILVTYTDTGQAYFAQDIRVTAGVFSHLDVIVPVNMMELIDPEIYLDEYALLNQYINQLSPGDSWRNSGLKAPFTTGMSAFFGTYRRYNGDGIWQRHTGIDYPHPVGTPVSVTADGRVALVERLPIRGNYVLIDHGSGLFSGYAHLQETYVEAGDPVRQGDVIGIVGNTGRSTGAHLHWELALGGAWVDPQQMLQLFP